MPHSEVILKISLTERPQFSRLVDFVGEVYDHAEEIDDYALMAKVDQLKDDLAAMRDDGDDPEAKTSAAEGDRDE